MTLRPDSSPEPGLFHIKVDLRVWMKSKADGRSGVSRMLHTVSSTAASNEAIRRTRKSNKKPA